MINKYIRGGKYMGLSREEQILRDEQTIKRLQARIKENKAKESEK